MATPAGVALLSFTNVAIDEFHRALADLGHTAAKQPTHYLGTLDSFIDRFVLQPFGARSMKCGRRPRLFAEPSPWDRQRDAYRFWDKERETYRHAWEVEPGLANSAIVFSIPRSGPVPNAVCRDTMLAFARDGWFTHQHRGLWAYCVLRDHRWVTDLLARRFPEVIVDESQDTSEIHHAILELLRASGAEITLIGDPDQCIFEFNQADTRLLREASNRWEIPELRLTINRRSCTQIVEAARNFGTEPAMEARYSTLREPGGAFITFYREDEIGDLPSRFAAFLGHRTNARDVIVSRSHSLLRRLSGGSNHHKLQGATASFGEAAFQRDIRSNLRLAFDKVLLGFMRLTPSLEWSQHEPDSPRMMLVRQRLWSFLRNRDGLPGCLEANEWLEVLRTRIKYLIEGLSLTDDAKKVRQKLTLRGMPQDARTEPLFVAARQERLVRMETTHKVKGETVDALMLVLDTKQANLILAQQASREQSEELRLAYVAMTRPRDALVVAVSANHYKSRKQRWSDLGFRSVTLPPAQRTSNL